MLALECCLHRIAKDVVRTYDLSITNPNRWTKSALMLTTNIQAIQ